MEHRPSAPVGNGQCEGDVQHAERIGERQLTNGCTKNLGSFFFFFFWDNKVHKSFNLLCVFSATNWYLGVIVLNFVISNYKCSVCHCILTVQSGWWTVLCRPQSLWGWFQWLQWGEVRNCLWHQTLRIRGRGQNSVLDSGALDSDLTLNLSSTTY